jgi:ribonuclease P protein component
MIRSATDFARLQQEGRSRAHPLLLLRYRRNDLDRTRYGISTARRIGSAVVRNRLRRQLRALLRRCDPDVSGGWDVLIVVRGAAAGVRQPELEAALTQLLAGARLRKA